MRGQHQCNRPRSLRNQREDEVESRIAERLDLALAGKLFGTLEQLGEADIESVDELEDTRERGVALAALNT